MNDAFAQMVRSVVDGSGDDKDLDVDQDPCSEPGEPAHDADRGDEDPLAAFDAVPPLPPEDPSAAPPVPQEIPAQAQEKLAPTKAKLPHSKLIMQGICSECAHCGMSLTDSVSIERGIGPTCSRRGYLEEDPKNPDELQALIELSEYPELVDFLTEHYRPKGLRGFMNGLVKVCSLNRRTRVHEVCTNAIDALGYQKLAATLRESLSIAEIKDLGDGTFEVWVKKGHFNWTWSADAQRIGATRRYGTKGLIVRLYEDADKKTPVMVTLRGRRLPARGALWLLLNENYGGYFVKIGKGAVRIQPPTRKDAP